MTISGTEKVHHAELTNWCKQVELGEEQEEKKKYMASLNATVAAGYCRDNTAGWQL